MKKSYTKPMIEIESYELSASIAQNCLSAITLGPEFPGKETCKEFEDAWEIFAVIPGLGVQSTTGGTPFYSEDVENCNCYYNSGGNLYFSS